MKNLSELIELVSVKPIGENVFEGTSKTIGSAHVFGGQVLAQGLHAMTETVPTDRFCHSLHSYFVLPGDLKLPIRYEVEVIRDGGSFSSRRVLAKQNDEVIFLMAASFQLKQQGYEHQISMPKVPDPDTLFSWDDIHQQLKDFLPKATEYFLSLDRPVIFKPTEINNPLAKKDLPPNQNVWIKFKSDVKTEPKESLKKILLTYASDYNILTTALHPHASKAHFGNTQMASIDHAMWFYRDFNVDDWLLYSVETPSSSGARGFACGNVFSSDGKLIASAAQEGLMRPKN